MGIRTEKLRVKSPSQVLAPRAEDLRRQHRFPLKKQALVQMCQMWAQHVLQTLKHLETLAGLKYAEIHVRDARPWAVL